MREAILRNQDADCILYLGDGIRDAEELRHAFAIPWVMVRGNCDFLADAYREEEAVMFENVHILLTHGHRYGVKGGLGALISHGRVHGYDIVLYGHTHMPMETYLDDGHPIYLFNPGSIGKRDAGDYSFGLITIKDGQILLSHGKVSCLR